MLNWSPWFQFCLPPMLLSQLYRCKFDNIVLFTIFPYTKDKILTSLGDPLNLYLPYRFPFCLCSLSLLSTIHNFFQFLKYDTDALFTAGLPISFTFPKTFLIFTPNLPMLTPGYHLNIDFLWEANLDCHSIPAHPFHLWPPKLTPNLPLSPPKTDVLAICSHSELSPLVAF